MSDIIANMGETVFAVGIVLFFVIFAVLTALVRTSQAREHLKKNPVKKCPFCAEIVKLEAKVCKHCGRDFEPVVNQPVSDRLAKDGTIEEYERWKKSQGL
jgi:hypothetical protein